MMELRILRGLLRLVKETQNSAKTGSPVINKEKGEALRRRFNSLDRRQIDAWRAMGPVGRLELAFQAYQFALDAVRLTEQQRHPDLPADELAWCVTRRMQGDPDLGR